MTPNLKNIQLWVDALRSGKYKQSQGSLCKVNVDTGERTYCCLGVATDQAISNGHIPLEMVWDNDDERMSKGCVNVSFQEVGDDDFEADFLPPAVMTWLGLDYVNPDLAFERSPESIQELIDDGVPPEEAGKIVDIDAISANDDYGYSFEQIADALERKYLAASTD